ncbi:hypothetical protein UlMin_016763 [Ulmus minor]
MASCFSPLSISGGGGVLNSFLKTPKLSIQTKSNRNLSVHADYSDSNRQGGGADFLAGFLVDLILNQCPCSSTLTIIYHFIFLFPLFPGKQRTKQTLNEKISQLNSTIDNVSSLLRDGNNSPKVHIETDPEVEATI